jgi:hypothetical protein
VAIVISNEIYKPYGAVCYFYDIRHFAEFCSDYEKIHKLTINAGLINRVVGPVHMPLKIEYLLVAYDHLQCFSKILSVNTEN